MCRAQQPAVKPVDEALYAWMQSESAYNDAHAACEKSHPGEVTHMGAGITVCPACDDSLAWMLQEAEALKWIYEVVKKHVYNIDVCRIKMETINNEIGVLSTLENYYPVADTIAHRYLKKQRDSLVRERKTLLKGN